MKKNNEDKDYKITQSTSSPGALGEDVNKNQKQSKNPISKEDNKTSKQEGLNEERSTGDAGAFEGLENSDE